MNSRLMIMSGTSWPSGPRGQNMSIKPTEKTDQPLCRPWVTWEAPPRRRHHHHPLNRASFPHRRLCAARQRLCGWWRRGPRSWMRHVPRRGQAGDVRHRGSTFTLAAQCGLFRGWVASGVAFAVRPRIQFDGHVSC